MTAAEKIRDTISEYRTYWRQPAKGEYVPYKEVAMLALGVMGCRFATIFSLGFGSGNSYTGLTLGMDNIHLVILGYVVGYIGYGITGFNAYFIDNHRLKGGKYRPLIKAGYVSCAFAVIALWLPWKNMISAGGMSYWLAVSFLFLISEVQSFFQSWFSTGCKNLINVITPNTNERSKLFAVYAIITNIAPTVTGALIPVLSDAVADSEYTVNAYRASYTPFILIGLPISMLAYYGTKERIIVPKSRITKVGLVDAFREVFYNRIFWIRCMDGWNDFLEGAKNNIWNWMINYQQIMPLKYKGIVNLLLGNASLWSFFAMPPLMKKYGKKKIKIAVNTMQIFLIIAIRMIYQKHVVLWIIIMWIDRFIDTRSIIDASIDADMRDNQQYLSGVRIDGPFSVVQSVTGAVIGQFTGLFIPWVWNKYGISYKDTNWDLFKDKNIIYPLSNTLLVISAVGAVIDVIPWFFYNLTDTDQKATIRAIRIRTLVEDFGSPRMDKGQYLDGCDAVRLAREHNGREKLEITKDGIKKAKALPTDTTEKKEYREKQLSLARQAYKAARNFNEEVDIASFVTDELNRFNTEAGIAELKVARAVADCGIDGFHEFYGNAQRIAYELPAKTKQEKRSRRRQIFYADSLKWSAKKIEKHYPDGFVQIDESAIDKAEAMPSGTKEERSLRRKAVKKAVKERNLYARIAKPYLSALIVIKQAEGYAEIDKYLSLYDDIKEQFEDEKRKQEMHDKLLNEERKAEKHSRRTDSAAKRK